MSVDNPTNIPPINLNLPHQHRCMFCGDTYSCVACEPDPDNIYLCAHCEREDMA